MLNGWIAICSIAITLLLAVYFKGSLIKVFPFNAIYSSIGMHNNSALVIDSFTLSTVQGNTDIVGKFVIKNTAMSEQKIDKYIIDFFDKGGNLLARKEKYDNMILNPGELIQKEIQYPMMNNIYSAELRIGNALELFLIS